MNDKIQVTRSSMPPKEEYFREISELWDSCWLTNMGEKHNRLEQLLKEYMKVPHVSLFSNGHMALELALQAMELSGEVITTPFTFASTTHAIVRNNLKPVFCDINSFNFTIDASKIEELITEETSAIVPVHVYGNICDLEAIDTIAKKYNLKVLYDAAHAFGVFYNGMGIGNFGDASMFSFHATKVFNTIEGGAVCYHDEAMGQRLYQLKNFGIQGPEVVNGIGANAKMNEFQAAMGICNLRHIEEEIEKRRLVHERYRLLLSDIDGLRLPVSQNNVESNYSYFPVIFDEKVFGKNRNQVYKILIKNGVNTRKYFYPLTSAYNCYADKFNVEDTPVALEVSENVLTLPMYADLSMESVEKICDIIEKSRRC